VEIVGRSRALIRALELADRFAPTPLPILLVGATGTGKELFAQRIHEVSGRRGPLVAVNCAALPRDMVESLLFGHRRGAFTGAVEAVVGYVEAAAGGTLFLDELASLSGQAQGTLLRVLETKEVNRLGETRSRPVDFRVVASAQEDVRARVHAASLRLDLYQRVAGVVLDLPPLKERPEDIVPLAEYFAGLEGRILEPGSLSVLLQYPWPGNVRELRTAIERAGFLSERGTLSPRAVAEAIALGAAGLGPGLTVDARETAGPRDRTERGGLLAACEANGWDARRTAAALGIGRSTLYDRLRAMGLSLRLLRAQARTFGQSRNSGNSEDSSVKPGIPATRFLHL
jgi:transcriptional regulator with PAS, ATPase and Fis domain